MVSKENGRDLVAARSSGAFAGRRISRGGFLRLAGAGVLAGAGLGAFGCTANTTPQQASSGDDGGGGGGGGGEKAINIYNWSDYFAEDTVSGFEKEAGVKATVDFYTSNEELLAKLQAGGTGYDWIVPSDYMVTIMRQSNVLQPLDKSKIPNVKNIGKDFLGLPYDPDNEFSLPYQWGTTGILYNPEVTGKITSWDPLYDEKYKGRIGMLNDVRETFASALYRLGYSPNTTDEAQLDEATQMLKEQKPLVRGYFGSPEARDLVVGGDLALTLVYSGDAFTGIAENEKLAYVIPEEGATRWTDNMAIPKGATHPDVAHEFINYILEPKVGAALSNYTGYGTPNEAALPMIDPAYRDDPQVYPPPKIFDKLSVLKDLGEGTREYERRFTEIKSS